ncbi:hypothetical protein ACFVMC_17710 [Nocardia sp. NPDC127579]|uniref:hypothetical protein n=1 Tax=Nocardia sp. NPDC127579 TaxID=3345402 RepID=UPI003630D018
MTTTAPRSGSLGGGRATSGRVRDRVTQQPGRVARRVHDADQVKSTRRQQDTESPGRVGARGRQAAEPPGRVSTAAQRAYAKRKGRAETKEQTSPKLPSRRGSVMATRIPFVAAIIALLGCGLALTLLLTTRAAEDSYQLSDARSLNRKLSDERAGLQREVEAADSAPELAARARELGMIPAKDPARLVIAPDGTVTVVGEPTPAQGAPVPPLNTSPAAPVPMPHAQAHGERVVPVAPPRTPGQTSDQAGGATAHTSATPSPAPAASNPAQQAAPDTAVVPGTSVAPSPVPSPIVAPPVAPAPQLIAESPVPQPAPAPTLDQPEVAR